MAEKEFEESKELQEFKEAVRGSKFHRRSQRPDEERPELQMNQPSSGSRRTMAGELRIYADSQGEGDR
jgi:hypothetical protein